MKKIIFQVMLIFLKICSNWQIWIIAIALGVWLIVLQNFGVFSKSSGAQPVYVVGGDIDANVRGSVKVKNTIEVEGSVWVNGGTIDASGSNVRVSGGYISTW